jgi:hypothetical protein
MILGLALAISIALVPTSGIAATPPAESSGEPADVIIDIESPLPGEVVRNKNDVASIKGAVRSGAPDPLDFDVLIAIDVSKSTQYPSGIDINEDGETGFNPHEELIEPGTYPEEVVCTDLGDTILAAEVKAAHMLVESLSPDRSKVGVIIFSGEVDLETGERKDPRQQDATVKIPLTSDFEAVHAVLDEVLKKGPHGSTNFAAAVRLGVRELVGLSGAKSEPRLEAKKLMQFLTDGVPTFPFGRGDVSDPEDIDAAINAARLANKAGITINTFALGRYALASPVATTEIARLTGGVYTPVRNPGEILAFLQGISFANVDDVVILNTTTNEISYDVQLAPDGSFRGFVPVVEGPNSLEITALAGDGGQTTIKLNLDFEKAGLTEHELQVELERIRKRNRELMLLLERKRIEEFRASQRKRVELSAED